MKAILTSALGGYIKTADGRIPDTLLEANGLLDTLHFLWKAGSKVMIICGSPDNHDKNDSILSCLHAAFPMSGLMPVRSFRGKRLIRNISAGSAVWVSHR